MPRLRQSMVQPGQSTGERWTKLVGALLVRLNWPVRLDDPPAVEYCTWKVQYTANLEKVRIMSMEMRMKESRVFAKWLRVSRRMMRRIRKQLTRYDNCVETSGQTWRVPGGSLEGATEHSATLTPVPPMFDDMVDSEGNTDSEVEIMHSRQRQWEDGKITDHERHLCCRANPIFPADIETKARAANHRIAQCMGPTLITDQLVTEAEFVGQMGGPPTGAFQILSDGRVIFETSVHDREE